MKTKPTKALIVVFFLSFNLYSQSQPPGQMVDIGGYKLHFNVMGTNGPTIIIEPGAGSWSLQWFDVQQKLSENFRVITYDRAGYGWSDPSPYSRTADQIANELKTGLEKLSVKAPYIFLGHSYGGLLAKAYANKYPDDVLAIIFAESASEYQFEKLPPIVTMILEGGKEQFKQSGMLARMGAITPDQISIDSTLQQQYWDDYQVLLTNAPFYDAVFNEMDLLRHTYKQSMFKKPIDKPILVITAENSFAAFSSVPNLPLEECNAVWFHLQDEMLSWSSKSSAKVIGSATHDLLLTAPMELADLVIEFVKGL
ncbi:MAG: alpha/beta hydrolase [Cyclobacteriaceae bacterium]